MAALDLLGRRWALRVLWELRGGPLGFRELQTRCDGMSSSVLRTRVNYLFYNVDQPQSLGYFEAALGVDYAFGL